MSLKKKVICLVIDTELTNEQIQEWCDIALTVKGVVCYHEDGNESVHDVTHEARNVRVLDSDEIKERNDD